MPFISEEKKKLYNKTYQTKHAEKIKAKKRAYYLSKRDLFLAKVKEGSKSRKKQISEYHKEHYKKNKDKIKAYQKRYAELNKEKVSLRSRNYYLKRKNYLIKKSREYGKEYRKTETHKILHIIRQHKRRIKVKEVSILGSFTKNEWIALKKKHNNACLHCKKKEPEIKLTVDHIIPISKGGTNKIENIQPLCARCNSSKGSSYYFTRKDLPANTNTTTTSTTSSDTIS